MPDVLLVILAVVLGWLVVGLGFMALLGATLGRRARKGRREGRYTSTPGNSADAGSSSSSGGV
ncbi:hypothetical protein [Streptomyces avicenniae]|uniref:hypothetical protein n=1 Tax=Streptomyces avicenniae TaxID=500153 RepID=UPI00069B0517|nr:hypothetical protein [Streptomyces avicenniae]